MSLELTPYRLRLREPLLTARGPLLERVGTRITLKGEDGISGEGDAAPFPGLGATIEEVNAALEAYGRGEAAFETLPYEARSALEGARLDQESRRRFQSLSGYLAGLAGLAGHLRGLRVPVHALVQTPEQAVVALRTGFRTLKLKVGAASIADDVARIYAVRQAVGPAIRIRLDANRAWSLTEAISALSQLREVSPDFIEEPVKAGQAAFRELAGLGVALAVDESAISDLDFESALSRAEVAVVVLKPSFCGGPLVALRRGLAAVESGKRVVVTSVLESAIGRLAALHVAALFPFEAAGHPATEAAGHPATEAAGHPATEAAGLEGPFETDLAPFPETLDGSLEVPAGPGLWARA